MKMKNFNYYVFTFLQCTDAVGWLYFQTQ